MTALENRIPPPIVAFAFALGMAACAYLLPVASLDFPGRQLAAGVLLALGLTVILATVLQFVRARTTVNPLDPEAATSLVTDGLFRFTRNPMYLGMALILAAGALWLANGVGALLPAGFVAYISRFQIAPEERALRVHFGEAFEAYAKRVRRWL
jgi:protein-S-isoprenylcysteine O-methyltransferase Ste14